jgi:hypothetical protein
MTSSNGREWADVYHGMCSRDQFTKMVAIMMSRRARGLYDDIDKDALNTAFTMAFSYVILVEIGDGEVIGLFTDYDKFSDFWGIAKHTLIKDKALLKLNAGLIYEVEDLTKLMNRARLEILFSINNRDAFLAYLVEKGCELIITGRIGSILKSIDAVNCRCITVLDKHYLASISKLTWK